MTGVLIKRSWDRETGSEGKRWEDAGRRQLSPSHLRLPEAGSEAWNTFSLPPSDTSDTSEGPDPTSTAIFTLWPPRWGDGALHCLSRRPVLLAKAAVTGQYVQGTCPVHQGWGCHHHGDLTQGDLAQHTCWGCWRMASKARALTHLSTVPLATGPTGAQRGR